MVSLRFVPEQNARANFTTNISDKSMTNLTAMEGHIISKSLNPGYMVLSYVICYIGAWTTVELIHKRTAMRGGYNWAMLGSATLSMGGVATWCMHFIGTRATIMGNGDADIQIAYSSGFTTLSFFVPIIVLCLAFLTVGSEEQINIARISLGGILAGFGFCSMYYLGEAGITNYACVYIVGYVFGSAILACLATTGALFMFFYFRSAWDADWRKRAISGFILSIGISGMHWLATVGTQYQLETINSALESTSSTITVVLTLSVSCCLGLMLLPIITQAQKARGAKRAQEVVLAAAIFDYNGKILVTPSGLFPSRKVTQAWLQKSFNDTFTDSHPIFIWIYRTTFNWTGIGPLVPAMRGHIERSGLSHHHLRSESQRNLLDEEGSPVEDYTIIFRELFCIAAADLAEDLHRPLDNMGILYEDITSTGHKSKSGLERTKSFLTHASRGTKMKTLDAERQTIARGELQLMGKGQLLFLVSRADRQEAENLQAAGYRFASKEMVQPFMAASLQITLSDIATRLNLMLDYVADSHILEPGIHIACFAIRASIGAGFDVLARKDAKNLLPTMQLPIGSLESSQLDYLKSMNLLNVTATMKLFTKASKKNNPDPKQREFAQMMLATLDALKDEIDDPFFNDAKLISTPIDAPCRGETENAPTGTAKLITYKIIIPIHARAPGKKLQFVPLNLFRAQQRVYKNSSDHDAFAQQTFKEFSKVLDMSQVDIGEDGRFRSGRSKMSFRERLTGPRRWKKMGEESEIPAEGSTLKPPKINFWAKGKERGDHSSERSERSESGVDPRTVNSNPPGTPATETAIELQKMSSNKNDASPFPKQEDEQKTYIDYMFNITIKTKEGAWL